MAENVNLTPEIRQKAVDFMNSSSRKPEEGLAILEEANYKPHVIAIFRDKLGRKDIPDKIVGEIRLLLRYHANPDAEIHKDIPPVNEGTGTEGTGTEGTGNEGTGTEGVITDADLELSKSILEKNSDEYPPEIKQLIETLALLYKTRSAEHVLLKEVGEGADEESNAKRAAIANRIINLGELISTFAEIFENFTSDKEVDLNELGVLLNTPVNFDAARKEEADDEDKEDEFVLAETLDLLKKQQTNLRSKISKARNTLIYQSTKKEKKENPMPEGPKRIKIEKRIEKLEAQKNQVDMAIAQKS